MIRILHAADLHLDSPFASLPPEQSAQRREEQRQIVRQLADECSLRSCHLLLLAGDLFDSDQIYQETAELLCEALGGLRAQVFIAPGNHDPWSPGSPYATLSWPDNVHVFRSTAPEAVRLEQPAVTVYGAAFTEPHAGSLLEGFSAADDGALSVLVIHGTLDDPNSRYNPISEEQIAASGVNYLALGHVHRRQERVVGKTTVVNPGCAMGRGFDETGPKGAVYAELDENGCRLFPVDLGARVYESLTVRVEGDPLAAIQAALPEKTERDLYRIRLVGDCPTPDPDQLHAALDSRFYALELIDETLPPLELWKDAGEDSLKGEFLRQLKECYDADTDRDARRLVAEAARLGVAVMEGREVPEL
ncbi:MAG: DNA repair exonuclease [Oscillospiraceae bacterium]|nr:DNA repair exonuclease [Oscillospiraceae bacterium]